MLGDQSSSFIKILAILEIVLKLPEILHDFILFFYFHFPFSTECSHFLKICCNIYIYMGLPCLVPYLWSKQRICQQCKRPGFNHWVRKIPWRREGLLTPVFLTGESHGQRSLEGHNPWGHKELDTTEGLTLSHFHFQSLPHARSCFRYLSLIRNKTETLNFMEFILS